MKKSIVITIILAIAFTIFVAMNTTKGFAGVFICTFTMTMPITGAICVYLLQSKKGIQDKQWRKDGIMTIIKTIANVILWITFTSLFIIGSIFFMRYVNADESESILKGFVFIVPFICLITYVVKTKKLRTKSTRTIVSRSLWAIFCILFFLGFIELICSITDNGSLLQYMLGFFLVTPFLFSIISICFMKKDYSEPEKEFNHQTSLFSEEVQSKIDEIETQTDEWYAEMEKEYCPQKHSPR